MSEEVKIKFVVPGPDEPGYLRRQRKAIDLVSKLDPKALTVQAMDEMVEFLCQFVTEPEEEKDKFEALLDLSQNDFTEMLRAVAGGGGEENPT